MFLEHEIAPYQGLKFWEIKANKTFGEIIQKIGRLYAKYEVEAKNKRNLKQIIMMMKVGLKWPQ